MIWAGDRGKAVLAKTELRLTSEHPTAVSPEHPFLPFVGRGLSSKIAHGGWDPRILPPWTSCVIASLSRPQCFPLKMRLRASPISWDRCEGTCKTGWQKPPVIVAVGLFKKMRHVCGWAQASSGRLPHHAVSPGCMATMTSGHTTAQCCSMYLFILPPVPLGGRGSCVPILQISLGDRHGMNLCALSEPMCSVASLALSLRPVHRGVD